jgi:hypothetical protein
MSLAWVKKVRDRCAPSIESIYMILPLPGGLVDTWQLSRKCLLFNTRPTILVKRRSDSLVTGGVTIQVKFKTYEENGT